MSNKIVYHMVWIKAKPDASEAAIAKFFDESASRLGSIEGVLHVRVGKNFTERAKGFGLGIFVTLKSKEALAAYQPHPVHVAYKTEVLAPFIEEVMAMDFEDAPL